MKKLFFLFSILVLAAFLNFGTYQYKKSKIIDLGEDDYGNTITMYCDDYNNGIKNGNCSKYVNGKLFSTCNYVDNLENGILNIYRNDKLSTTQGFKMGLKHGYATIYKDTQPVMISKYENDLLEGISKTIKNGNITQEVLYLRNEPQIVKDFDHEGHISSISTFYPNNREKNIKYSYDNLLNKNIIVSISNYHNDHYEGIQQFFDKYKLCDELWYDDTGKKTRHIYKNCSGEGGNFTEDEKF